MSDYPLTLRHMAEECNHRSNRYDNLKISRCKDDRNMDTVVTRRLIARARTGGQREQNNSPRDGSDGPLVVGTYGQV